MISGFTNNFSEIPFCEAIAEHKMIHRTYPDVLRGLTLKAPKVRLNFSLKRNFYLLKMFIFGLPFALVVELVDTLDSKSNVARRAGSIPAQGTMNRKNG